MTRHSKKYHLCACIYRIVDDSDTRYRVVFEGDVFYLPTYIAAKRKLSYLLKLHVYEN